MKRIIKWLMILAMAGVALIVVGILALPAILDTDSFKPRIEESLSDAVGRDIRINGPLKLSLFPFIGFVVSDFRIASPEGFSEPHLLRAERFEIRVAAAPLLSRRIRVERIGLIGPQVALEKAADGRGNWEGLGGEGGGKPAPSEGQAGPGAPPPGGTPGQTFGIDAIVLENGRLLWIDHAAGLRRTVTDVNLSLADIAPDTPLKLSFSAVVDDRPISLSGAIGPFGAMPPAGNPIPLDLTLTALETFKAHVVGRVQPGGGPEGEKESATGLTLSVDVPPFSPRAMAAKLGRPDLIRTSDPSALDNVSLKARLSAGPDSLTVSDGHLTLDGAKGEFHLNVARFDPPDIRFGMKMDALDADRYRPPSPPPGGEKTEPAPGDPEAGESTPGDRAALRRLKLAGELAVGRLTASGLTLSDLRCRIAAEDGVFRIDGLDGGIAGGALHATARADARPASIRSGFDLKLAGVRVGELVAALSGKDRIEAVGDVNLAVSAEGETPAAVKRSLSGGGSVNLTEGALKGWDLTRMTQNVKALLDPDAASASPEGRTDFSELNARFTIAGGVLDLTEARLMAPLMRVTVSGSADIAAETLDLRTDPRLVSTLKGQGDTAERSGVAVPLLITGTFADPIIRPDVAALAEQLRNLDLKGAADALRKGLDAGEGGLDAAVEAGRRRLEKALEGTPKPAPEEGEKKSASPKEKVSDFIRKLPFGQ